ncbi:MAG: terminase large subunit [Oscillospiraceae bacterium]|jgi:phage terminase large subunit-like protein|nr:terminase large subunit [Oscillospiraceae bacterium]
MNEIIAYISEVEGSPDSFCREQKELIAYISKVLDTGDVHIDEGLLFNYLALEKYFPYKLFNWQKFLIALHLCTFYNADKTPRFPDLFMMIGRGAGKDGYIAFESFCLASTYSGLKKYDVDICANNEEQAMRPVQDILEILGSSQNYAKLKRFFEHKVDRVIGAETKSVIRGRTNSPKSRDGMRSGMVVFNEIHQFQNYDNIKVFVSGKGKVRDPRELYATTNGDVREGPLDEMLAKSLSILSGEVPDNGFLPFICRLDDKREAENPTLWDKANPSLPYLPVLRKEIEKEFREWKLNPVSNADFMTKRMNLPQSDAEVAVTDWENIEATNKPLPPLDELDCTAGLDYASASDLVSVNLHFRSGNFRYDINHSWLCLRSKELYRLKIPWHDWADAGHITLVDDVEISPELVCDWLFKKSRVYNIKMLGLDSYRYSLMKRFLAEIGFREKENLKLIRSGDIAKTAPVIESCFVNHYFTWGDNPPLRWAANNTKLEKYDNGNVYYGKIEPKARKTDPFMALAASMAVEDCLDSGLGEFTYIEPIMF